MSRQRSQAESDLDARHDDAARLEMVVGRDGTISENLQDGFVLQEQATEFARAFSEIRDQPGG